MGSPYAAELEHPTIVNSDRPSAADNWSAADLDFGGWSC